jgi:ADP-heptose:LPS heptosyltransferase
MKLQEIDSDKEFVIVHPLTLGSAKVWSRENFIKLINYLASLNINIIVTGSGDEKAEIDSILREINGKKRVYGFCGLPLKELAALIHLSVLFISNSTGPIHIAAAVGTFVVGIYSPVVVENPVRWGPVTDKKKIFVPEKDDNSRDVMDNIKPEEVFEFIKGYLYARQAD